MLVADDEQDIQFLFKQKFKNEIKSGKLHIKFAYNGQTALELIETVQNCAEYFVLTDINMPEMSGTELLKEQKLRYPKIKLIMITAYGNEHSYNLAKKNGADDFFYKTAQI